MSHVSTRPTVGQRVRWPAASVIVRGLWQSTAFRSASASRSAATFSMGRTITVYVEGSFPPAVDDLDPSARAVTAQCMHEWVVEPSEADTASRKVEPTRVSRCGEAELR